MDCENLIGNINTTTINDSIANATDLKNASEPLTFIGGLATLEQHQMAKHVLYFYVLPCIAAVGVLGNTLSVSVIWENRGSHAFNAYLMALTSADILLLLLALSRCVILIVVRYPEIRYPLLNIYSDFYLGIVLGSWLQRISSTLISIIALERFVAVAFPFKVKSLALENHPLRIIAGVVLANFLCQVPTAVLLDVIKTENEETNSTVYSMGLRYKTPTSEVVRQIYLVFLAVINNFIPLLIVSVSTVAIVLCLRFRSAHIRSSRASGKEAEERETMTLTLVSMAIIFTLCYIPAVIIYAIASTNTTFYRREVFLLAILVDINIVCLCINSASDFLIYFLRSKQFRSLFVARYFPCLKTRDSPRGSSAIPAVAGAHKKTVTTDVSRSSTTSITNVSDNIDF